MSKARQYLRDLEKQRLAAIEAKKEEPRPVVSPEWYDAERSHDVYRFLMEEPPGPTHHGSSGFGEDIQGITPPRSIRKQDRTQKVA